MAVAYLFDETLLDPELLSGEASNAGNVTGGPQFGNTVLRNPKTGVYKTNVNRFDPTEFMNFTPALLTRAKLEYFLKIWRGGYGSGVGLRCRIPWDFTAVDEVFATGNGTTTIFYLKKTYTRPGVTARQDVRRIYKPVTNSLLDGGGVSLFEADGVTSRVIPSTAAQALGVPAFTIKLNTTPTTAYTINNTTGKITFSSAPGNGVLIKWSGEFDTPVAFVGNDANLAYDVVSRVEQIRLREVLGAELGITI